MSVESADNSLLEFLDLQQLNCLNESSEHALKPILAAKAANNGSGYLLSDADEQLLLNITFNQAVRVRSILIRSSSPGQAPKTIKLAVNKPSIGFEDVEDAEEPDVAQVLELRPEDVSGEKRIPIRYVRFQAVRSLHIFVGSNQGEEDETRIDAIDVFGTPVEATKDLSGLRQQEE